MAGTRRENKTKTRRRKPQMTFHIRDTMRFVKANNINRDRKRSQPLQETIAFRRLTKAVDIKRDYGQSHKEICKEICKEQED